MPVYLYEGMKDGAPATLGQPGDFINVLDACLVTGYGSKPAAGWSKVYSDPVNHLAVYRAPVGNRLYLHVDNSNGGYAYIQAFATMSGVNYVDGTEPIFYQQNRIWKVSYNGYAGQEQNWVLIASERGFYWVNGSLSNGSYTRYSKLYFFGDYVCPNPDFKYNTFLAIDRQGNSIYFDYKDYLYGIEYIGDSNASYVWRGWNNIYTGVTQAHLTVLQPGSLLGSKAQTYPNQLTGGLILEKVRIYPDSCFMGFMPGLYEPQHNLFASQHYKFRGVGDLYGRDFIYLALMNASAVIQISGEWY